MDREPRRPDELLLDELADQFERTRNLLRASPEQAADRALERLGGQAEVEARIAVQLARDVPLAFPERFAEAHRQVVRALEVLDREGFSSPRTRGLGPLNAVVEPAVEFVAEYIVKSYAESVSGRMRSLYARREAQSIPRSPERATLARARAEMDMLSPGFRGGGLLAPFLLIGGLLVPALAGLGNYLGAVPLGSQAVVLPAMAVLFMAFYVLSSVLLQGAGVARRRSRLIMGAPLAALWETVGGAGSPPEDDSTLFGVVAVLITALSWLVLPIVAIAYVVLR